MPGAKERQTGEPDAADKPQRSFRDQLREHWLLAVVAVGVLLVALIGGIAYWLSVRNYETTDDAFVAARSFSVAAKVGGYVTEIPVTDNQHVNAGELLARSARASALARIYLAVGLPLLFLPVTTASYDGVPPEKTNQASALINVARNIGGSMGVALAQTALAQRQQFHQSRLVEHIAPSDLGYQQAIDAMTRFFQAQGSNASDAASQAVAWVGQTLQQQVDLLAYIDVFWLQAMVGVVMVPLALSLKRIDLSAPARGN